MRLQSKFAGAYVALMAIVLSAPFVIIMGVSLNEKKRLYFPPRGLSIDWFADVLTNPRWLEPIGTSLLVALIATTVATSIALPICYVLWRHKLYFAKALFTFGLIPFMLPPVTSALGFLIFWSEVGAYGSFWATAMSHGIFLATVPLMMISLGLETVEENLVEAASTMGATEWVVTRTILAPLIMPYVFGSAAFCFALSLNEYIIAFMVAGFTVETLPIKIVNSLRYGYSPAMAAVSVLSVFAAALLFSLVARYGDLLRMIGSLDRKS